MSFEYLDLLTFTPAANFYGNLDIPVVLYEVDVPGITPAESAATISISINPVNDPPSVFVFSDEGNVLNADPTLPIEIYPEHVTLNDSNITTYRWEFGAYDFDIGDNLTIYFTQPTSGNLTVDDMNTRVPCSYNTSGIPCAKLQLPHPADSLSWVYTTFQYQPDPGYHGDEEIRVYVQDQTGVYSDVITIKPGIMETPCRNGGKCRSKDESLYNCTNYRRAEGFDLYYECACAPGWTGMHCEEEDDVSTIKPGVMETPCKNGGTCISKDERVYKCTNYNSADSEGIQLYYDCACAPGWTGIRCEDSDDVSTANPVVKETPCKNGGTCKSKDEHLYNCTNYRRAEGFDLYYECACAPGWTGMHCEDDVSECGSSPCSPPYICYDDVNRYNCACAKENPNCDGWQAWMIGLVVLAGILIIILSVLALYLCMLKRG
ncbi:neurogenic locus notch homolog protein 1-like [Haliotis rubra]|uniref:neurogenic locus notch homolog protein 1-like n=1 Tax=Haliotis rubra TaxID=36100 RepID=UPI001EE5505F|nr:neurogenic locus notch homolog protein 1-like [Haliotis rubra]